MSIFKSLLPFQGGGAFCLLDYPADGGSKLLRSVSNYLSTGTASCSRRFEASSTLSEPQITHCMAATLMFESERRCQAQACVRGVPRHTMSPKIYLGVFIFNFVSQFQICIFKWSLVVNLKRFNQVLVSLVCLVNKSNVLTNEYSLKMKNRTSWMHALMKCAAHDYEVNGSIQHNVPSSAQVKRFTLCRKAIL
jgi:hypothetical protein